MPRVDAFLDLLIKQGGSDLHLISGNAPRVRLLGEIHPVKYGGSPTDSANKIALDPPQHRQFNAWWYRFQRNIDSGQ